jgi:hypothetical protein
MDMSGLNSTIKECVIAPAQELYDYGMSVYKEIEIACDWIDKNVDALAKKHLTPNVHYVAMTIFRSLPETMVCAACMTGFAVGPALVYWSVRIVKVSWPLIKEILNFQLDTSVLGKAAAQTLKDLFATYKGFRPAIAACAIVASVAAFVFGWVGADYPMMVRSTIYGVVSQLAIADIAREAPQEAPQEVQPEALHVIQAAAITGVPSQAQNQDQQEGAPASQPSRAISTEQTAETNTTKQAVAAK